MPITSISLMPSAFSDGPRIVEKSRGTAHPSGRVARRPVGATARPGGRRRSGRPERGGTAC
jgi:hypothetical protein